MHRVAFAGTSPVLPLLVLIGGLWAQNGDHLGVWLGACALFGVIGIWARLVPLSQVVVAGLGLFAACLVASPRSWPRPRQDLVRARVMGASRPGEHCRVRLEVGPSDSIWARLPARPCIWAQGDEIEIPARRWPSHRPTGRRPLRVDHYIGHARSTHAAWLALARWRQRLHVATLRHDGASFALASVSGMPQVLPLRRVQELRGAGLSHLMAVSGIHVGSLATLLASLGTKCWIIVAPRRVRVRWRVLGIDPSALFLFALALFVVLLFVLATGGAPSAFRALTCWGLLSVSQLLGLNLHRLGTLGWIAWAMVVVCPIWWNAPGYYCSMVATAILLTPAREHTQSAHTSLQLCWGLAPVSLLFFEKASFLGVVANLVAVPVFSLWVLPLGLCALAWASVGTCLGYEQQSYDGAKALLTWAGYGGDVILAIASLLGPWGSASRQGWAFGAALCLLVYPVSRPQARESPAPGGWQKYWPARWLLWLLASAVLWSYLGV